MQPTDDHGLATGLKNQDPLAFEQIVRSLGPRLLSSAMRVLGNAQDAEDAVQEAFVSAWKNATQFSGNSTLYTWLHRIVINACLARLRSQKIRKEIPLETEDGFVSNTVEITATKRNEVGPNLEKQTAMRNVLHRALGQLPEDLRLVLLLRDVEELSSKETAEQLAISDALVRQRLHRARTIMAETLRPELCAGPELTCGGRIDLLFDYIDEALPTNLNQPVHEHVASCPDCKELLGIYRNTISLPLTLRGPVKIESDSSFVNRTLRAAL